MRDILFRGKSLDKSGVWVLGSLIHRTDFYGDPCDDYFILYGGEFDCDYYDADRVDPETVGQFTGLTDKNGKKIFEGDILETEDRIVVVTWHSASACWDSDFVRYTDGKRWTGILANQWSRWASVIGNIHDNPELLKNEHPAIL